MSEILDVDAAVQAKFEQISTNMYIDPNQKIDSQTFTLYPNYVEAKVGNLKKAISLLDFKSIIDGLLNTEAKMSQISLPYNCYTFGKSATEMNIGCYHPERIAEIQHLDYNSGKTNKYTVPFPNTVVSYKLALREGFWVVTDTRYFCTNKKVTQLPEDRICWEKSYRDGLWTMPFPNFYTEGRMCYGRNTMPSKYNSNLRGLDYYYQVIFESAFNNDLGIGSVSNSGGVVPWLKELSKLTAFPYDRLRKDSY